MSNIQPWRPPVPPPKTTKAAVQASIIAARNVRSAPIGSNDAPKTPVTSKAALAAAVAGHARTQAQQGVDNRHTSISPTRGRSPLSHNLDSTTGTNRPEQSPGRHLQPSPQRQQTAPEIAARLASASSSPPRRLTDTPRLRPTLRTVGSNSISKEEAPASSAGSHRERSGSDADPTSHRTPRSKSPSKIDFTKIPPLAMSTTSSTDPHTNGPPAPAPPSSLNACTARQPSILLSQDRPPRQSLLSISPDRMTVHDLSHKIASVHQHHHHHHHHHPLTALRTARPASPHHQRKHSSSVGELHKPRIRATYTMPMLPIDRHTRISPRRATAAHSTSAANSSHDRIKNVSNLADAMVGASLASTRVLSRTSSPHRKPPPLPGPRPRSKSLHAPECKSRPEPPPPLKPMALRPMRHTLRKQHLHDDEDEEDKRGRKLRLRKHPNVHHEGDRKRWRDKLTVKQRKRYEGLWAANRGLLVHEFETVDYSRKGMPADDLVVNVVVRDIWERSRLPRDVLEEIWDLVADEDDRALGREQFIAGLWLIDQRLKGRKLPVKVSASVWASIRHPEGVKISRKRL